jgi:PIN domain nuclease of toxin-antitoxin system
LILLDSYAVIALLTSEPAADTVAGLLHDPRDAALTALGVAEVLDRLIRGAQVDEFEAALDLMQLGLAPPIPVDAGLAMRAGLLRARSYHRTNCAVSLADCVAVEAARRHATALASSDPHLLDVCRSEGVDVIALPNRAGRVWSAPNMEDDPNH